VSVRGGTVTAPPRTLYVHDDLTDEVRERHGGSSQVFALARRLMSLVARDPARVVILRAEEQLQALIRRGPHPPFAHAIGIGRAGVRVARQVHARTGWFPRIDRVELAREEDGQGGYRVISLRAPSVPAELASVSPDAAPALVDDTIFSGLTMRTVLDALPAASRRGARIFCLRGVGETVERLRALCPVSVGLELPGKLLEDVSLINASGLVRRGSIRRAGRPPLAFFERREWMAAWFAGDADAIIDLCRTLNERLDSPGPATPHSPPSGEAVIDSGPRGT
jgi:hypothetical protein